MQWPNGQTVRHRASPVDGYDLCYSARPGDSVTFYTARQGLRVEKEFGGEQGVLVRPDAVDSDGVRWLVVFDGSPAVRYCDVRGSSTFVTFTDEDDGDVYDLELRVGACCGGVRGGNGACLRAAGDTEARNCI